MKPKKSLKILWKSIKIRIESLEILNTWFLNNKIQNESK